MKRLLSFLTICVMVVSAAFADASPTDVFTNGAVTKFTVQINDGGGTNTMTLQFTNTNGSFLCTQVLVNGSDMTSPMGSNYSATPTGHDLTVTFTNPITSSTNTLLTLYADSKTYQLADGVVALTAFTVNGTDILSQLTNGSGGGGGGGSVVSNVCKNTTTNAEYSDLNTAFNEANDGDVIQLTADIDLTSTFYVNSFKNITLDLNGHVLNASNIPTPTSDGAMGSAIAVNFNCILTIIDTNPYSTHSQSGLTAIQGGVITGGKGNLGGGITAGGAIENNGTLNITGGTICGNTAGIGGAISNSSGAKLTITNCHITGNSATVHGGAISNVYGFLKLNDGTVIQNNTSTGGYPAGGVYDYSTVSSVVFNISGKVIISDNTTTINGAGSPVKANLCLDTDCSAILPYKNMIGISSLATGTNIGVTTMNSGAVTALQFTSDCAATDAQYFSSDNSAFAVYYTGGHLDLILSLSESEDMSSVLEEWNGKIANVQIKRTFYKDGNNNTLCLPFALNSSSILTLADSPLAGYATLKQFSSATIVNKGQDNETLELTMKDATVVEYGTPYIISWASGDDIVNPVFERVTINNTLKPSSTSNGVQFCGTFAPKAVTEGDKGIMFVGSTGQLNWPNVGGNINGFRSYFTVDQSSGAKFGMLAFLMDDFDTPTAVSSVDATATDSAKVKKFIEDGKVVIISNGKRYSLDGKEIK